nr:hypothetical protein [Tanacetum cinerariifolium]
MGVLQIGTRAMVIENKVETLTITTFWFSQEIPPCRYISMPLHFSELTISSPDHSTSNIEDAFSSNFPDYTTALPRNISPDPPDNLSKYLLASPAISPFHNVQAYNVVANKPPILPQDPITPPTILTPSSVLPPSPLFDPRYFFVPEKLLPPKKQIRLPSSSSTTLSNSSQKLKENKKRTKSEQNRTKKGSVEKPGSVKANHSHESNKIK